MTTSEILDLDYADEKNKEIIQKALRKIKPLSKYDIDEEVPLEVLETLVSKYQHKYCLFVNYITPTYIPGERNTYCATCKRTDTLDYIGNVYSSTIYELFAKLSIKFYYETQSGNIPTQDWEEIRKQRKKRLKEFFQKDES